MGIEALEQPKDRPLRVRHQGAIFVLPDPRDLTHREITGHIDLGGRFLLPGARMPLWKATLLLERWLAHHDMGTPRTVARVSFLVDRFEAALTWDLQSFAGVDLAELWRARQWRRLLMLIDHLPRHGYYSAAVSNDVEYATALAEATAKAKAEKGEEDEDTGPSLVGWSPEVAALTRLTDAVKGVQHTLVVVNSEKPVKPPDPEPRPKTVLQRESKRAEHRRRQAAHEKLAARLLGNRYKSAH